MSSPGQINRGDLDVYARGWQAALARHLSRTRITPIQAAVASVIFAGLSAWTLYKAGRLIAGKPIGLLLVSAAGIQLRLLGTTLVRLLRSDDKARGGLYELAERIADVLILVGAGYASRMMPWGLELGTAAAILTVLTEHVALFGSSARSQAFMGPMTTQSRMYMMTLGCIAGAIEYILHFTLYSVGITLAIIVVGTIITLFRRIASVVSVSSV